MILTNTNSSLVIFIANSQGDSHMYALSILLNPSGFIIKTMRSTLKIRKWSKFTYQKTLINIKNTNLTFWINSNTLFKMTDGFWSMSLILLERTMFIWIMILSVLCVRRKIMKQWWVSLNSLNALEWNLNHLKSNF